MCKSYAHHYICRNFLLMYKRRAAFITILIASFFYLAHAVIPHHHHSEFICLGFSHHNEAEEDHDCHKDQDHKHGESPDKEACVTRHDVILPTKQLEEKLVFPYVSDNLPYFFSFADLSDDYEGQCTALSELNSEFSPCRQSSFSHFISRLNGFRAPPGISIL